MWPKGSDLSERGRRLVESPPLPAYLQEHFARSAEPFDAVTRPRGYIPLCVAENKLVSDLLLPKLGERRELPARVLGYDAMTGAHELRSALADFMGRRFLGRRFAPEQLAVLAGAGSVLELLFHVIGDPGDGVLVPTPSYAGFWADLETRDALRIVPVHTSAAEGFELTPARLERALADAPCRVRALLFTSPDNPLGRVYDQAQLRAVVGFAQRAGLHLVMDEIYALSVFGERPFTSVASLLPSLGQHVHVVWAFSKDFAASGLRVGVLVSENTELLRAVDGLAYWAAASGHTQRVLQEMIRDDAWVDAYVATMRARLGEAHCRVTEALTREGIPHLPSEAGFFSLVDLRRHLPMPTWDGEDTLWRRLLAETNVNLTPGSACRVGEPGFMRLCFAGVPTDTAVHAVHALGVALRR
jgi:aspartate/methionine/tyrosine aminotransferase